MIKKIQIKKDYEVRLDKYLKNLFTSLTQSFIEKNIRKKKILINKALLNIEKFAKNLDLNSKDEDRMVLTNIVSEIENIPKDQSKNDLINNLKNI